MSLDFIRTLRHRGTKGAIEELSDPAALAAWIGQFSPAATESVLAPSAADVRAARVLREAVYQLISAARSPGGIDACPASTTHTITTAAANPPPAPRIDSAGTVNWHADDPVAAALSLIARDAIDLVSSPLIDRVRNCANPECRALFLDSSRPGTRRWCSMNTCGNLAKKATIRRKTHD